MNDYMAKVGNTTRAKRKQERKELIEILIFLISIGVLLGATAFV
ncbi:hypothetical protein W04_3549 [Pseudoalteromonas sp. SW0106-04]|nr:hypothetical protein [Pseudoalteromonas sp. SW0106-04]GAP76970.1 hypothetical protein W04_3549 [Pseudoalteromonas sp. SW0106-04]